MTAADILLAVPNISEGRDLAKVARIAGDDATLLDVSSDPDHHRSVLTYGGEPQSVIDACVAMVDRAVAELDLSTHDGVHPRFGVVDVLPFVPYSVDEVEARDAASEAAWRIAQGPGVPIAMYGDENTLPDVRRFLQTDPGPAHPTAGVICIGVRGPLIAFNVNIDAPIEDARAIARQIRGPQLRALGFELPSRGLVQVSMNLIAPAEFGIRDAYDAVARLTDAAVDVEVVGLASADIPHGLPWRSEPRTIDSALLERGTT